VDSAVPAIANDQVNRSVWVRAAEFAALTMRSIGAAGVAFGDDTPPPH
jgi:hypothetical protein